MKTLLLVCISLLLVIKSNSQDIKAMLDKPVEIYQTDTTIAYLLSYLETKLDLNFAYQIDIIPLNTTVHLPANKMTVEEIFNAIFKDIEIDYFVYDKQIILKKHKSNVDTNDEIKNQEQIFHLKEDKSKSITKSIEKINSKPSFSLLNRNNTKKDIVLPVKNQSTSNITYNIYYNNQKCFCIDEFWRKKKFFISYSGNHLTPAGIQFGIFNKIGFMATIRHSIEGYKKIDGSGWTKQPYWLSHEHYSIYNGNEEHLKISYTLSLIVPIYKFVHAYFGSGFGKESIIWEADVYKYPNTYGKSYWVEIDGFYEEGAEYETGILINYNRILINAGVTSIKFRNTYYTAGLGITF